VKKKIAMFLLVIALALSLGVAPAVSVNADGALPHVNWLPPLSNQGDFQLKDGSTLPIKFTLTDPNTGAFVEDTSLSVDVNQVLFRDDFNDGNAEEWTPVGTDGTWGVEYDASFGSKVYSQSDTNYTTTTTYDTYWHSYGNGSWGDYIFEAKVKIVSGGFAPIAGIFFRVQGTDPNSGYYMFRIDARSNTGPALIKSPNTILAGGHPGHPQFVNEPAVIGHIYTLKVIVEGSNIKCYVDGIKKIEWTDSTYLAGRVGVGTFNAHTHFDDVMVLSLSEAKTFPYGTGGDNVRISYDTIFSDDFSFYTLGTNGTPVWTPVTGDWSVENGTQADGTIGQVYSQNDISDNNAQKWSLAGDASWTDYVVEAKVKGIEGHYSSYGTNTWDGIVFRAMDSTHFYEYYYRTTSQDIIVVKHDGGIRTVVSGPVPFTCENGIWYTLKVVVKGNSFRFYAGDVEISGLAFTDSSFASGKVGVYVWDGSEAQFDDVMVQTPPHYIANLHTKESGMTPGELYLITVWSGNGDQLGTYLFDLTDAIQGKGRGKGKA
jgi:hypothetical protein